MMTRIYAGTGHLYTCNERPYHQGAVDSLERKGLEPMIVLPADKPAGCLWAIATTTPVDDETARHFALIATAHSL